LSWKVFNFAGCEIFLNTQPFKMSKISCLLAWALFPACIVAQVVSVQSARTYPLGAVVTVRGVVTSGAELGKIRYLQDATAGIAAYPGTGSATGFEAAVSLGDSVEVTGTLVDYQGLLEISPISAYTVVATDVPIPAPKILQLSEISGDYESQLVGFECVAFAAGGGVFSGSGAYSVADGDGNTAKVFLRANHPLLGEDIPGTPVFLTALLTTFNGYQLLPRTTDDFSESICFYYVDQPQQSEIAESGFLVTWQTNHGAVSSIRYGTTPALGMEVPVAGVATGNSLALTGLQPGTIYWVQVKSTYNGSEIFSESRPFATQSTSSGQIKVFFNHALDPSFANGFTPEGQSSAAVVAETIDRINGAQQSLDVAMYNNNRTDITNALKNASARGVRIRYVAALDASNTALQPIPAFPVLLGNTEALMHDKFMVVDANLPHQSWVMSGSLNWTNQNINTDFNNTLFIQDQSLARAYTLEFEEMWGGQDVQPNPLNSRFGSAKRDNTPHHFVVGGHAVDSWFSPSDRTTAHIVENVYTAEMEMLFATFSFTKDEIGDAVVDIFSNNIPVRGMIENISDPGVEIDYLNSVGIDCRPHAITGDLHHKYAVIDANGSDPKVITGSHNWSVSAETANDENTLVLHDERLASLFKAEFEKRWQENAVSIASVEQPVVQISPNPVIDYFTLQNTDAVVQQWEVQDMLGRVVAAGIPDEATLRVSVGVASLKPGHYVAFIRTLYDVRALPFQKI
jgi:hypothetical protein